MNLNKALAVIFGMLAALGACVILLSIRISIQSVQMEGLARRITELEQQQKILGNHHQLLEISRDEHARAINAHQEYIEAKQKGFANAWHYARHEGWMEGDQ